MKNLHDYIKQYGNMTFEEKKFTEIDNIILALIPYIPLKDIVPKIGEKGITISEAYQKFSENHSLKDVKNQGIAIKKSCLLFPILAESKRYQNLILSNFEYKSGDNHQFGACTITINKNLMYVAFEGTDDLISGWEEDFRMSYEYPVISQLCAIKYLRKVTKIFGPNIIVGGHSKGGNLAIVASMNLPLIKKHKLIKIYCNDGPGLRKKEFKSKKYKEIEEKLENIIPNGSFVGILLRHKKQKVVKSNGIGPFQHDAFTWEIEDDKFIETKQNKNSINLDKSIIKWLEKHNDEQRKEIVDSIFSIFKEANIVNLKDFRDDKINNLVKIMNVSKSLDKNSKDIMKKSISLLISEIRNNKE